MLNPAMSDDGLKTLQMSQRVKQKHAHGVFCLFKLNSG